MGSSLIKIISGLGIIKTPIISIMSFKMPKTRKLTKTIGNTNTMVTKTTRKFTKTTMANKINKVLRTSKITKLTWRLGKEACAFWESQEQARAATYLVSIGF